MTSSNPGPGEPHDPAKAQETAQWWATPPAGTDPGQPVTGVDPTMLNYGAQPAQPDPTMLNYGGQPPADPTMLNYGAGGPGYTPPAQAIPQPAFTGGQYAAGQPLGGQPFPPAQPIQPQPQQFAQPAGGYGYAPAPPPSGGGSKTGWIVGGVIGLVVLVGIGIGVIAVATDDSSPISPLGSDKKNMDGNYSMANITNACSLIDASAVTKWSSTSKGSPTHTETKPTDYSGGSMNCKASYTSKSGSSKYHDNEAEITLDVGFTSAYGGPTYDSWKQMDTGTTGSGRASGDLTGIGSQGYWHTETSDYSSFTVQEYTAAATDSNVSVKIKIDLDRGPGESISKEEMAAVAKEQLQKALTALKKK